MNLSKYRTLFIVSSLVLILFSSAPTLGIFIQFPKGTEPFSEIWILGPTHMIEKYPFNVRINEQFNVFVGIGNHLGYPAYYLVYVKFRNQTLPLPNAFNSKPSSLPPLYEFRVILDDGAIWETYLNISILHASRSQTSYFVDVISINNVSFTVDCPSTWDSEYKGFYYQLFFELWLYNVDLGVLQYHNRFVSIWLKITD